MSSPDAAQKAAPETEPAQPEKLHPLQRLLDNPWWLLFLGLLIPFLSYTAWGWIELTFIGPAQLP
ncbi:MAG: hypothetical protein ACLFVJ_00930 [Persicimonas sp.]